MEFLSQKTIFSSRSWKLVQGTYKEGSRKITFNFIEHPQTVVIIPFISKNEIILIRQYRYPLKKFIWELPAGKVKEGESIKECAARELEEETGFKAGKLKKLFSFYSTPGYSSEIIHVFIASELKKGEQKLDEREIIPRVKRFKIKDAIKLITERKIKDGKTILALLSLSLRFK